MRFGKVISAALFGGLCAVTALAPAQARELKIGTISAAGSPWDKAMQRFAEVVKDETGGDLTVKVYTDGQLGDIQRMLTGMQLGNVEMGYFGLGSVLFLKGAEAMNVIYVPYLFKDREQAQKALNSDVFKALYDDIAKKTGVRVFAAFGARSPRALQTTKGPIMKPEDVAGMKLRIPGLDIFKATFETLGVQMVPMGMTEIYTALSKGIIEGQDNGFDLAMPLRFYEVAKYWSATDHAYEVTGWFISEKLWQSLNDDQRAALVEAAEAGGEVTSKLEAELAEKSIQTLKDNGVTYVVPDREAFREKLKDVYKAFDGKAWPKGFVDQVRAID